MFKAQNLSNSGWAFATVSQRDGKLFAALARTTEWYLSEFNAQGVANTAWAFAMVNHRDEKLFAALAGAAERRLSKFNL